MKETRRSVQILDFRRPNGPMELKTFFPLFKEALLNTQPVISSNHLGSDLPVLSEGSRQRSKQTPLVQTLQTAGAGSNTCACMKARSGVSSSNFHTLLSGFWQRRSSSVFPQRAPTLRRLIRTLQSGVWGQTRSRASGPTIRGGAWSSFQMESSCTYS